MTEQNLQSEADIVKLANCIRTDSGLSEKTLVRCLVTDEGISELANQLASQVSAQSECFSKEPRAQLSAIREALRYLARTDELEPKVKRLRQERQREEGSSFRVYGMGAAQAAMA